MSLRSALVPLATRCIRDVIRLLLGKSDHGSAVRPRRRRNSISHVDRLEPRLVLSTFFYESFENGLNAQWSLTAVNPEARVSVRDLAAEGIITNPTAVEFTRSGNSKALVFDSSRASGDDVNDLGIAVVSVDLTGISDGIMTFHHFEVSDNNHLLPDQHSTSAPGDGVAISRDGVTWYRLISINGADLNRGGDGLWQMHEIDLGKEFSRINTAFSAGLAFNNTLRLKFSQYDRRSLPTHGWAIDEIRIQDEADPFTLNRPRGAFHRFNLTGENDDDYYFRAAVYGNPDATTPIIIAVHGSDGDVNFTGYSWNWHAFVSDPANAIESLIVVTPAFVMYETPGRFSTPVAYNMLSWNTSTTAAADLALLQTVDTITQFGIGDGHKLRLWGFSAGGQFTGRFTAAHPDRVAAAVVGGPSSQILPDPDISYPYGFGHDPAFPKPSGISLSIADYLKTRIMFWVGQDDDDPNHPQLGRGPSVDSVQGITRLQRAINQFEAVHLASSNLELFPAEFEYELYIDEGDGHDWDQDDIVDIYEFMMRDESLNAAPVKLHSRIVRNPSLNTTQQFLPQSIDRLEPGEELTLEVWVEAPPGSSEGVQSGTIEVFFESDHFDVLNLSHGAFSENTSGIVDPVAGRIRSFGGRTSLQNAGISGFALFGQVHFRFASAISTKSQAMLALQRFARTSFTLTSGLSQRTDIMPLPKTIIAPASSNPNTIQGAVFEDLNGDGIRQGNEPGMPNRMVQLALFVDGPVAIGTSEIEPDAGFGNGSYLQRQNPLVTLSAIGNEVRHAGIIAAQRTSADASTGTTVFGSLFTGGGSQSIFTESTRQMRMDFRADTTTVSIDIVGLPGTNNVDVGRLTAFNSHGTQLASVVTGNLVNGQKQTLTISRPQGDIAWAIVSAANNQTVRLDNLRFSVLLNAQTDQNGHYRVQGVPVGTFFVSLIHDSQEFLTLQPASSGQIAVAPGSLASHVDFGIDRRVIVASPGWTDTSLTEGTNATYSIRLLRAPMATATVAVENGNPSELQISPRYLTFTSANWNTAQTILVGAVDDSTVDGDQNISLGLTLNGIRERTATISVLDNDTIPPSPVITAPAATTELLRPVFRWTEITSATDYEVLLDRVGMTGNPFLSTSVSATSYTPVSDLPIGRYSLSVRAVLPSNQKTDWRILAFQINTRVTAPGNTRLQIAARPALHWLSLPGAAKYDLWINHMTSNTAQIVRLQNLTSTSWTSTTDMPIGIYQAWVRAIDATGTAATWSTPLDFQLAPRTALQPITVQQNTSRPTITWFPILGTARYDFWLNNRTTGQSEVVRNQNIPAASTSWQPAADLPLGQFRAWIRAIDEKGIGASWSHAVDFSVMTQAILLSPLTPTFSRRPEFTWSPITGASTYDVYVRNLSTNVVDYYERNLTSTSWTPSTDLSLAGFRWWVQAVGSTGFRSFWSSPTDFNTQGKTRLLTPAGSSVGKQPTLTWQAVHGAVRYELFVTRVGVQGGYINLTNLTTTSYTPTVNLPTGPYRVWVRAVSGSNSPATWSDLVEFKVVSADRDENLKYHAYSHVQSLPAIIVTHLKPPLDETCAVERITSAQNDRRNAGSIMFSATAENKPLFRNQDGPSTEMRHDRTICQFFETFPNEGLEFALAQLPQSCS